MDTPAERYWRSTRRVTALLLALWFLASFGSVYFARELDRWAQGWPLGFWMVAQGALLVYLGIVIAYAGWMSRLDRRMRSPP